MVGECYTVRRSLSVYWGGGRRNCLRSSEDAEEAVLLEGKKCNKRVDSAPRSNAFGPNRLVNI
jgi:hypothetical protein